MELIGVYFAVAFGAYLVGSVPFGFIIGKFYGKDLRHEGSGNIGATNVTRVIGSVPGKICFFLDLLKGLIPVAIAGVLPVADPCGMLPAAALLGVVFGHMFTFFLGFKGGKGIATAAGGIVAISPWTGLTVFLLWALIYLVTRYVSLGSIIAAAALPLVAWGFSAAQITPLTPGMLIFFTLLALLAIAKHKSNIQRLLNGTESRFKK